MMRLLLLVGALCAALFIAPAATRSAGFVPPLSGGPYNTGGASAATYTYGNCTIFTAHDWYTEDLLSPGSSYVPHSVDPASATIISNIQSFFNGTSADLYVDEANPAPSSVADLAGSAATMYTISGGTIANDTPYNDNPSNQMPWIAGFKAENDATSCAGDCHALVITQNPAPTGANSCIDYETYQSGSFPWTGSGLSGGNGGTYNLSQSLNSQLNCCGVDAAGLPILGMVDFAEDASLTSIPHVVDVGVPKDATGANTCPKSSPATHTASNCPTSYPFALGMRLQLNPSLPCDTVLPTGSFPQSNLLCHQLQHYGMIVVDYIGEGGCKSSNNCFMKLRLGYTACASGTCTPTNPWLSSDLFNGLSSTVWAAGQGGDGKAVGDIAHFQVVTVCNSTNYAFGGSTSCSGQ